MNPARGKLGSNCWKPNANAAALAAAEAAVLDQDYAKQMRNMNNAELQRIEAATTEMGIEFIPSVANFYLLKFTGDAKTSAGAGAYLEANGIIPRPVNAGDPENCLRITVGLPEQNDRVIAVLREFMAS